MGSRSGLLERPEDTFAWIARLVELDYLGDDPTLPYPWVAMSAKRCVLGAVLLFTTSAFGQWVSFENETAARNTIPASRFETDTDEKDYAWGDVDRDSDIDLVVVRKQPVTTAGKRPNYLFLNDHGVLIDGTDAFATASSVPGDLGFNTPTNDRDVVLVDVDLDGWLDIVTATAISDTDPKHIGHPRVYHNRGCTGACAGTADWLGFRFENERIPNLLTYGGQSGFNPRFTAVHAGDVTGDGYPELWFSDHDSSGEGGPPEPAGADFNDRLLINLGVDPGPPGTFVDGSLAPGSRFSGTIFVPGPGAFPFIVSNFGAAGKIGDFNGDGRNDIVKQSSLNSPLYVGIAYNNANDEGYFEQYEVVYQLSAYYVSTGDLNNDQRLDLVITDNGADRYLLNQGNGADGMANFEPHTFSFLHVGGGSPPAADDTLGGESIVADLDHDGWNDVLIADFDVDLNSCSRRTHIYKNNGGTPGSSVQLQEQTMGTGCNVAAGNPASCLVASIPSNLLEGTYNVAPFDINGDGWTDLVIGRCSGTEIWINQPPPQPVGSIVDEDGTAAHALLVGKQGPSVTLSWGESCTPTDQDFGVYRGSFDPQNPGGNTFSNHGDVVCTTNGSNGYTFLFQPPGNYYYLVVPHNGTWEGSYGTNSAGAQRPQGSGGSCFPQTLADCE